MEMDIYYEFKTGENKRPVDGGYEWDGDEVYEYIFQVTDEQLREALEDIIVQEYFSDYYDKMTDFYFLRVGLCAFLKSIDIDDLCKQFENEIKDYFENDAMEEMRG